MPQNRFGTNLPGEQGWVSKNLPPRTYAVSHKFWHQSQLYETIMNKAYLLQHLIFSATELGL
jgi:hypothetical protein